MKTTMKFFTYGFLIFTLVFTSCSKDGEIGPIGPAGAQGIAGLDGTNGDDGANGTDGTNGTNGTDGNANVITSAWLDAVWNERDNATEKTMRITLEEIGVSHNDLSNNSLILIYLKQFGTSSIYTMPSSGRWGNTWYSFTFGNNQNDFTGIRIRLESTNSIALTEFQHAGFRGNRFRYIIIPANTSAKSSFVDYNKMTYEEVINHLGLKE